MPDETWLCYWNADMRVGMASLVPPLSRFVSALRGR